MGSRLENKSAQVRKRIENHTFEDEEGEEYKGSKFGGFTDYFRRKKIKLQNLDAELRAQSASKPQIFRNVVAHVNGYTQPSLNDLHALVVQYGGGFMQYLDGKTTVTHVIASNLTPKKALEFKRYRVVKPAWIVESVRAGKLLPWDSFRVLDEGAGQRVIGFEGNGRVVNLQSSYTKGYKEQTENSWYTSQLAAARDGAPRSSSVSRPFLAHATIADEIVDSVDAPPSAQIPPSDSSPEVADEMTVGMVASSHSSPPPQQTPKLLRDLRKFRDVDFVDQEDVRETSPTPQRPQAAEDDDLDFSLARLAAGSTQTGKAVPAEEPSEHAEPEQLILQDEAHGVKRAREPFEESPSKRKKMTAEDHNAILLADPRVRKSTVVNPEFLEQYYRESRLHHLSTWKADLKSQLQAMAQEKSLSQKARQKRPSGARRYVLHVDFDSFFAAVSLKKCPQYKDMPVVVAHGGGTGSEIASCNYPAREYGVKNGMWMKRAQELCPDLKVLPYDFPGYEQASTAFYEAILATGGIVQSVSIDEALVDISSLCFTGAGTDGIIRHEGSVYREQAEADRIAQKLREEVKSRTDCHVSVGIGANILQAKVALRKAKPAGQFQLRPEDVMDFIGRLDVMDLPGVAFSIGGKLEEIGIKLVKDVREVSREKLISTLGPKTGEKLWEYARGIDRKEVGDVEIRKSVSAEVNWGVRFYNQEQVDEFIENLCGELNRRLVKEGVKGRQLSLKLMRKAADAPLDPPKHLGHGKCDTFNRSVMLGVATNGKDILTKETLSMLKSFGFTPGELRGIGVQMTRLEQLKSASAGQMESSQRRLRFKTVEPIKSAPAKVVEEAADPIEDVVTPKKPKAPPDKVIFGALQLNQSSPSRKPLNTLGTQFILPSQVDPQVLAELPAEIRSRLAQCVKQTPPRRDSNELSKSTPKVFTALPSKSQLDPDILKSLPEDMRSEILSFYDTSPKRPRANDQSILPQSPRKQRTIAPSKRGLAAPTGRRRGRPGKFDDRSRTGNSTLTQSNFIATRLGRHTNHGDATITTTTDTETDDTRAKPGQKGGRLKTRTEEEELDPEFLAALPDDLRREVLAEQRNQRLSKTSNLQIHHNPHRRNAPTKHQNQNQNQNQNQVQNQNQQLKTSRRLLLPPKPALPKFTTQKLSTLPQIRDAIGEWVLEFRVDGPYAEDVAALGKYLDRVVCEERDMNKAVSAVKWLRWCVDEDVDGKEEGVGEGEKWRRAVCVVEGFVGRAVQGRGLGVVDFG